MNLLNEKRHYSSVKFRVMPFSLTKNHTDWSVVSVFIQFLFIQFYIKLDFILIEVCSLDVTLVVVSAALDSVVLLTVLESHCRTVSSYSLASVHLASTWGTTV